jgi:hypothetical protein
MFGEMAQVIEHLPSKCEALSSIPNTEKKSLFFYGGTGV